MLQVMTDEEPLILMIKVASTIVMMTMERDGLDLMLNLFLSSQVYLFQWKEYGLCLASQQVGILAPTSHDKHFHQDPN